MTFWPAKASKLACASSRISDFLGLKNVPSAAGLFPDVVFLWGDDMSFSWSGEGEGVPPQNSLKEMPCSFSSAARISSSKLCSSSPGPMRALSRVKEFVRKIPCKRCLACFPLHLEYLLQTYAHHLLVQWGHRSSWWPYQSLYRNLIVDKELMNLHSG